MSEKTVFLVAGGTGGHVFPALALAEALQRDGIRVVAITDRRGEKFYRPAGIVPHVVSASAWSGSWKGRLLAAGRIIGGIIQSFDLCREYRPSCVVGFGGYPSFPTLRAAQFLGIPTVLHEQNAVFGRANRQLAMRAAKIATSFQETRLLPGGTAGKTVFTGNPVREALTVAAAERTYKRPKTDGFLRLFIFGGSQGSQIFSDVLPAAVALLSPEMRARLRVTQQARHEDVEALTASYAALGVKATVQPFFNDILKIYHKTHLVISRAGASTIAELTVLGLPSVVVPLAISLDGDQARNARHLVVHNAGIMMEEKDFTTAALAARLAELLSDPERLDRMAQAARALGKPAASTHLADVVRACL